MSLVLETSEERFIRSLLRNADPNSPAAVVLVGSAVRDAAMNDSSDIDILTIGVNVAGLAPPRIQVLALDEEGLRKRITEGDDFAQWAMRFGKPIAGRAYWRHLCDELLPGAPWPNHKRKREHGAVRLAFAETLRAMSDTDAAADELRFAVSHLARAELLERRVFPLARSELPEQLRTVDEHELAAALERLNADTPIETQVLDQILELARSRFRPSDLPA